MKLPAAHHSLTYYLTTGSVLTILVGLAVIIVLIAVWAAIEIWREEIKLRREREAELEAHRVARGNLQRHLNKNSQLK